MGFYTAHGRQAAFVPRVDGEHRIVSTTDALGRLTAECPACGWRSTPGLANHLVERRANRHMTQFGTAVPTDLQPVQPIPSTIPSMWREPSDPLKEEPGTAHQAIQEELDWLYAVVEDALDRAGSFGTNAADATSQAVASAMRDARAYALRTVLENDDISLLIGRVAIPDRTTLNIGRLAVIDREGEVYASSWKSEAAALFYDPPSDATRTRVTEHDRNVVGVHDDHGLGSGVEDALERRRGGYLEDILGTIQPDQFGLIRDPLGGALVIQGGAGSGKTAVALHRASLLAYRHRDELLPGSILVLAPSPVLLSYISKVLPGLGDDDIEHRTINGLVEQQARSVEEEAPSVARIKGKRTMRFVLRSHIVSKISEPEKDFVSSDRRLSITADELRRALAEVRARLETYRPGRDQLRAAWIRAIAVANEIDAEDVRSQLAHDRKFQNLLDRTWPQLSAEQAVFELLTGPKRLARAAAGILTRDEQKLLLRRVKRLSDMRWTASDLPLIDEAAAVIDRVPPQYDHIVVDEAQDLSPMQLRMISRRSRTSSYTVLGDLAQATAAGASVSWGELAEDLALPAGFRYHELSRSYRTPGETLDVANRLLPQMGLDITPPESVRRGFQPPRVVRARTLDVLETVQAEVWRQRDDATAIGVICPSNMVDALLANLSEAQLLVGDGRRGMLGRDVTVLHAAAAKGVEFDHVIVVEPAHICGEWLDRGAQALYVAMTRTTRTLSIVHQHPLPEALREVTAL